MATASELDFLDRLEPFLDPLARVSVVDGMPTAPFAVDTAGLRANAHYFSHPDWVRNWFENVHRYPQLRERWHRAAGAWDDKVVVDVGCGPGNLFVNLGGKPRALVGVDVARGSLEWAARAGYTPLLADAHALPLKSSIADIVALNATLHHCDDMERVLAESARLVKPDGVLITDHDPQLSAYNFRFLGKLLWHLRVPLYRRADRGGHSAKDDEQRWAIASEIHHVPGDGLTADLFRRVLEPLGFDARLFAHNQRLGAEVLAGQRGRGPLKMRIAQLLSGIRPGSPAAALSLLCVATKRPEA